ncbi:hypothetical protein AVEN_89490-1 [Araneus ventricosus]|uniref:Uncharacterized protein n=1 Tax=Araneus ventricosus TaxID=182803 RepID=A0A4Y2P093_ARAVE|nr:hypothetical protein AVEN_7457-1 [Araneus ventricosus]GBN44439.1 hypothetical protein AVEN_89490-1 [Araneus ventricosus]
MLIVCVNPPLVDKIRLCVDRCLSQELLHVFPDEENWCFRLAGVVITEISFDHIRSLSKVDVCIQELSVLFQKNELRAPGSGVKWRTLGNRL